MESNIKNIISAAINSYKMGGIRRQRIDVEMSKAVEIWKGIGSELIGNDYVVDANNSFVIENLIRWALGQPFTHNVPGNSQKNAPGDLSKGIFIGGTCGSGKSLAIDILKIFLSIFNVKIQISGNFQMLGWAKYRADSICDKFRQDGDLSAYTAARCIAIDDIGSEPREILYMGNRVDVINQVLEVRGDKPCITILTANTAPHQPKMQERYSKRVISRLMGLNYFVLCGNDRRTL